MLYGCMIEYSGFMNQRTRLVLLLTILLAFALRLQHLGAQSLWYDETVSLTLARESLPDLLAHTARDIHPPGYYLLLAAWLRIAPSTLTPEFISAFFSLSAGILLLPLTFVLGRRLRLPAAVNRLACLLLATSAYHVWYSQEVRMYTLGAGLGLLSAWGLLRTQPSAAASDHKNDGPGRRGWIVYGAAAVAGLYTLYYMAFLLLTLNLLWFGGYLARRQRIPWRPWLLTHAAILLAYTPWLPTAWRQVTDPPVPPWRSAVSLVTVLRESLLALGFGQGLPLVLAGVGLALLAVLIAAASAWPKIAARTTDEQAVALAARPTLFLLAYTFAPVALIELVSVLRTPLYHVRYVFTYAPPFSLLLALGVVSLWRWRLRAGRPLAVVACAGLILLSALSMQRAWNNPALAADDHRAAVRFLSSRWRPGDVILVNAGYAYTALLTYWDQPIAWRGRLADLSPATAQGLADAPGAVIVQMGSVDGPANLGWGDPRADFYGITADEARRRLTELAVAFPRLWQYRIYDTVTDPQGRVRDALTTWRLFEDDVFSGEANLRVQGFWSPQAIAASPTFQWQVASWLRVSASARPTAPLSSGQTLRANLRLQRAPGQSGQAVALSLRLVDEANHVWAQADEPVGGNQRDLVTLTNEETLPQPLRLQIPIGTPPGDYRLMVIFYDPTSGQALPVTNGSAPTEADALVLGSVALTPHAQPPQQPVLAAFGPLSLLTASSPATMISRGDAVPVTLLWQADQSVMRPTVVVVVQLLDRDGQVVASQEAQPAFGRYATSQWLPGEMVLDQQTLGTPQTLRGGVYRLIVGLYRAADGQRLRSRCGLLPWMTCDTIEVKTVRVRE